MPQRSAPVPLSPEEERTWRTVIRLMVMLPRAMDDDLVRRSGLSLTRYVVLMRLSEAPDRVLRMSDLAEAVSISPSRITRIVASMVREGLLTRETVLGDRRSHVARLTDAGLTRLSRAWPDHLAGVRSLVMDHIAPQDLDGFGRVARQLVEAVEAVETTRPAQDHPREPDPPVRGHSRTEEEDIA